MGTRLEEGTGNLKQYSLHEVLMNKDQVLFRYGIVIIGANSTSGFGKSAFCKALACAVSQCIAEAKRMTSDRARVIYTRTLEGLRDVEFHEGDTILLDEFQPGDAAGRSTYETRGSSRGFRVSARQFSQRPVRRRAVSSATAPVPAASAAAAGPPRPPSAAMRKFFGGGRWVKEQVDDVGDLLKVGKDEGLVFVLKLASRLAASSGPFCLSVSRRTRCCSGNSHSRWREVLVLRFTLRCSVPSHTPRCPLAASPRCAPDSGCASASGCARRSPRRTPNRLSLCSQTAC